MGKHKHKKSWAHNGHRNIALLRSNIGTIINQRLLNYVVMFYFPVDGTAHDHASQGVPLRSLWEDGGRKGGTQNPRPELPDRRLEMLLLQKGLRERRVPPGLCCILSIEFLTNIFVLSA